MLRRTSRFRFSFFGPSRAQAPAFFFCSALALALSLPAWAGQDPASQQSQPAPPAAQSPAPASEPASLADAQHAAAQEPPATPADAQPSQPAAAPSAEAQPQSEPAKPSADSAASEASQPGEITEDEIRKELVGKQLFLRGGYLDNSLSYNEHGVLIGHSPQGSYTLNAIQIDKVHLTRHKVELDGQRYGLHFLGALPYEDPTKAVDRVNITPKKKEVRITIDRELLVKPKQEKAKGSWFKFGSKQDTASSAPKPASTAPAPAAAAPAAACSPCQGETANNNEEARAEIAAAPAAERPADPNSVTTTISPAHANKVLLDAFDHVFAQSFDARMMDAMPGFWKLYYAAAAAKTDYQPQDPSVLRQNLVDQKAQLVSKFEPASNQYAQDSGVAGMSLYHVVVGADGKPGEISVARPIGFGLDENAVDAIRKATFSPAIKDGKPVPVLLDLVVEFRIYSKRTNVASAPETANQANVHTLPGPYSVEHQ
ncbi:MAG: energy transducer TonB [Terracidiphilus sp.]